MATYQTSSTHPSQPQTDQRCFSDRGLAQSFIDGGWWPRSLNLAAELPPLVEEMFAAGFDITDVSYNIAVRETAPHHLKVSRRWASLHGDITQDAASIQLIDSTGLKPVVVVVIPPDTQPPVAENALQLAGRDGNLHRPDHILPAPKHRPPHPKPTNHNHLRTHTRAPSATNPIPC